MTPRTPATSARRRWTGPVLAAVAVVLTLTSCTGGGTGDSGSTSKGGSTSNGADSPQAGNDGTTATSASAAERFGWTQRGGDEFTGSRLDGSKWRLYGGPGANEIGVRDPERVYVAQGSMMITASGDVSGGTAWAASPATTYGKWEFRARAEQGTGYAPAVLLWPDSDVWPQDGEIDVMEMPEGDRQTNHTTVHHGADDQQEQAAITGDFTQWHNYAVDWQPDSVTVYVDGVQTFRTTQADAIPHGPMHLCVQLDVGPQGNWIPAPDASTPPAVSLYVDWVRMYR